MLFSPELLPKVLNRTKTQTRRPYKLGDFLSEIHFFDGSPSTPFMSRGPWRGERPPRVQWQVGRTYAIQSGRGKPGVWFHPDRPDLYETDPLTPGSQLAAAIMGLIPARFRLTDIRREDVRDISQDDAVAEGFEAPAGFLRTWCRFYDSNIINQIAPLDGYPDDLMEFGSELMQVADYLRRRDKHIYNAWALTFELVTPER